MMKASFSGRLFSSVRVPAWPRRRLKEFAKRKIVRNQAAVALGSCSSSSHMSGSSLSLRTVYRTPDALAGEHQRCFPRSTDTFLSARIPQSRDVNVRKNTNIKNAKSGNTRSDSPKAKKPETGQWPTGRRESLKSRSGCFCFHPFYRTPKVSRRPGARGRRQDLSDDRFRVFPANRASLVSASRWQRRERQCAEYRPASQNPCRRSPQQPLQP